MSSLGPVARVRAAKRRLRLRIAARRERCGHLISRVVRPLRWVDRVEAWWRSLGPLARVGSSLTALLAWRWARSRVADQTTAGKAHGWKEIIQGLFARMA